MSYISIWKKIYDKSLLIINKERYTQFILSNYYTERPIDYNNNSFMYFGVTINKDGKLVKEKDIFSCQKSQGVVFLKSFDFIVISCFISSDKFNSKQKKTMFLLKQIIGFSEDL